MRRGPWIVAVIAFGVSANTLTGDFVWDDLVQIVGNPWIADTSRLPEAFATHVVGFDPSSRTSYYRPLSHVTFAAVHAAAGLEPWAYHLVNLLLHTAASVLVFLLTSRFAPRGPALLAAALFAVHPVHAEAVAWSSGIYDLAVAVFVLLSLLLLLDDRPRVRMLAPLSFGVALLWKEPAIALLPIAAARFLARREARWRELGALAAVAAAYLAVRVWALGGLTGGDRNPIQVGALDGVITAVALVAHYARLLVLPTGLSAVHDVPVATSVLDPRFLAGLALIVALGVAGWRARRDPSIVLGLTLLVFPLLPALYIPALKDSLLAERYLYLPSAGAALVLAVLLGRATPAVRPAAAFVGVAIVACAAGTIARNAVWRTSESLWTDATLKAPTSAVAWENLGGSLAVERRYAEAIPPLTRAIALDPGRVDALTNLALCQGVAGRRSEGIRLATEAIVRCPTCEKPKEVLRWLGSR